ncbi:MULTISPECIES: histidinol dehydrogenase, partial [unclassified Nocardiopsis]
MISRIDLRGSQDDPRDALPRAAMDVADAAERVRPLCEDVRHRGVEALIEITERFDGVRLTDIRVPKDAIDAALADLDPAVRAALEESIRRARKVHRDQRRT